jgi:3-deoxy-7-phosphoheptulonate synthase
MIIKVNTTNEVELEGLLKLLRAEAPHFRWLPNEHILVVPRYKNTLRIRQFTFVTDVFEIDTPYQLASSKWKTNTSFDVKGVTISNTSFTMMAGPCSVESEEQIFATAELLHNLGIKFIRGGAYKPRTSPYSFLGLGKKGLQLMKEAANQYDLRVVTEIMDLSLLDEVMEYADVLQVGSRNMQNFYMLGELGKINKPIVLKRGMHAKVSEWLLAAEYILSGGNPNVVLCERGIRSFDPETRNVMDVGVIPLIQELSHLPIIADPSHGTGAASRVTSMSLACVAAGANGLLIEIHPQPAKALSDSVQTISFDQFTALKQQVDTLLATRNNTQLQTPILKLQTL